MAKDYDETELLKLVASERQRSIGFELDANLLGDRERALNYYKGQMPDIPALPNRSKAVSSDVADAIETVLPDLIEIFTGGDDVVAFTPQNPEDEAAAKQETDYISHVVFQENDGFLTLYTAIKDALLEKIGVFCWWWGEDKNVKDEDFEGKTAVEMQLAAKDGEIVNTKESGQDETGQPLYSFTLRRKIDRSTCRITTVSPDDFSVAADTVNLKDTSYCSMRARPRMQDLIAEGFDPELVRSLPPYGTDKNTAIEMARDTAGEHSQGIPVDAGGVGDLRKVETATHFIKLLGDDGKLDIWRVQTGGGETILLEAEKVNRINFAAITPYPVAHRFYGRALADLLIEVQRIKTALTRMVLDSGYFALNQRMEVATDRAGEWTISDLLRNEPGVPIRSKTGDAVRPISGGELAFDAFGALEYFATVAEQRTGIVRNAQGLNPDTLHDTAKGAMALMGAAQKRVRLIARIMAETGIKDLFLGVHAEIRENATEARIVRLNGNWVPVSPSQWAERNDMTIGVGVGASGREFEIAALGQASNIVQAIVTEQGGAQGPIVTSQNVYSLAMDTFQKLGLKKASQYLTNPAQNPQPQQAPPPDPKLLQVQLEHQRQVTQQQAENALKQQELAQNFELKKYEIDTKAKTELLTAAAKNNPWPQVSA